MPYEYRKLSTKERQKIIEVRRQRGYPLHAPPHPFRERGTYLITAANYEHKPIMSGTERRTEFQEILLKEFHKIQSDIVAWVILPNHYHILASVESLDLISNVIQHIHGATSREWNIQDNLTGRRKVWYRYTDRLMRNETQSIQALNYLHLNPIRHGYVENAMDWPWSSLSMYSDEHGMGWLNERLKKYSPPDDFGESWEP